MNPPLFRFPPVSTVAPRGRNARRYHARRRAERCPSWPKERDWKSRTRRKLGRGFESRPLRLDALGHGRFRRAKARLQRSRVRLHAAALAPRACRELLRHRKEEGDEIGQLLIVELLPEVLGHDPGLVALRDLGVRVDDRFVDERGVLALEDVVEVRAYIPRRSRLLKGVAGGARGLRGGREDLLARPRVARRLG